MSLIVDRKHFSMLTHLSSCAVCNARR